MVRNQTKQNIYSRPGTLYRLMCAPTLSSLSTSGWSAWSCMSSASLGTAGQYKHYITRAYIWNPLERTMLYSRHARPAHFSSRN